ncbi:protein PSK SIMULATOR 1-like [Vigna umbellata]|uniref:protein PSK SIMULATOR 1-like n=1 Tax=Vigna umbellata TaxID=87088 RepID=UPI001F5E3835|nr:protein PSK SIMULATOR 1-like [Vigna umbellata]XP_047169591.1 protein PSK SIMULATOR 1-like [Vigna umbellata]
MGGETVNGSWFSSLWPVSRKSTSSDNKVVVGILALEVSVLMLKVVNLWQSLSDREVLSLREGIMNSIGVKMLVSDNDDYLMELAMNEMLHNFQSLARSVARLGKKCVDPVYHRFEHFVHNPAQHYFQWSGWEYRWKKMERKVKKMDRFVAAMSLLSQELEVLAEREQTFRRMQANPELHRVKLLEFQKKVMLQRQEVRNLRDMSPWNRSYDYVVRLLARSLFTILERIVLVFENKHPPTVQPHNDSLHMNSNNLLRSHSFSVMHSSVYPSENNIYGLNSGPAGGRPVLNSGFLVGKGKRTKKQQQKEEPVFFRKNTHSESKHLGHIMGFKGCMSAANGSPVIQSCMQTTGGSMRLTDCHLKSVDKMKTVNELSLLNRVRIYSKLSIHKLLKPASKSLGDAALALHYANMIVLIERMVTSPHLVDLATRDDLYSMLPTTVRTALRAKLKSKSSSNHHDANLAAEWSLLLAQMLEWLAPLAHNMINWHSVRNFEKENSNFSANVLLVQTLYFANQARTEAAIVDLLVGLNYVCRIDTKVGTRDTLDCARTRTFNGVRLRKNGMYNEIL